MQFTPEQYRMGAIAVTLLFAFYAYSTGSMMWLILAVGAAAFTYTLYNPHHMPPAMRKVVPAQLTAKSTAAYRSPDRGRLQRYRNIEAVDKGPGWNMPDLFADEPPIQYPNIPPPPRVERIRI